MPAFLDIPEEVLASITGEVGEVFDLISAGFAKMGAALDALAERISALEDST